MKLNRTLLRAIDILDILSKSKEGYTLAELSQMLECPKSSVFDIVKTLVYKNMLIEDVNGSYTRYKIGLKAFLIGSRFLNDVDIVQLAKDDLKDMATHLHGTAFMAVLDDYQVTYIYKYESESSILTTANIGTKNPLYSTGLGKVLLTYSDKETQNQALKTIKFKAITPYTIVSQERLIEEMRNVKEKGFAIDDRENSLYQYCAAAPIYNHLGEVIAAISCTGLYDEFINYKDLGEQVKIVSLKISKKLGYEGGKIS